MEGEEIEFWFPAKRIKVELGSTPARFGEMKMNWKRFQEEIPEKNTLAVVFQYKRRKYIVARYGLYLPKHEYGNEREPVSPTSFDKGLPRWFSESGNRLSVNSDDYWCYIEPVTIKKTYS